MTSVTIYLQNGCFKALCLLSDATISDSKLIKFEIFLTFLLIVGSLVHFCRIVFLIYWKNWFSFQGELNDRRVSYAEEHRRLMDDGFGRGHDFEMNRLRLYQGEFLMVRLE